MGETTRAEVEEAARQALAASQKGTRKMPSKTLQECLAQTMGEVGYVQKDATNDFQRYRYASAEAVLKKVNASLSSQGVCCASTADMVSHEVIQGAKKATFHAIVKLSLTFRKGSDSVTVKLSLTFRKGSDSVTVEGLGSGSDTGDKAVMKANTAALKYCLANAFLISWGDDPEADVETDRNAASSNGSAKPKPKPSARARTAPQTQSVEGLINRIEAHTTAEALATDRELAEDCRSTTGEQRTQLQMAYKRHERTLREQAVIEGART